MDSFNYISDKITKDRITYKKKKSFTLNKILKDMYKGKNPPNLKIQKFFEQNIYRQTLFKPNWTLKVKFSSS